MRPKKKQLKVGDTAFRWCEKSPTATSPEQNYKGEETRAGKSWFYIQWAGLAMKMMDNSSLSLSNDNNTPKSFMSASPTTHVETFSTWTIAHIVSLSLPLSLHFKKACSKMKCQPF